MCLALAVWRRVLTLNCPWRCASPSGANNLLCGFCPWCGAPFTSLPALGMWIGLKVLLLRTRRSGVTAAAEVRAIKWGRGVRAMPSHSGPR